MVLYKCDFCGKITEKDEKLYAINIRYNGKTKPINEKVELCINCRKKIEGRAGYIFCCGMVAEFAPKAKEEN